MRIHPTLPTAAQLYKLLEQQARLPFSYPEQGATRGQFPGGYVHDRNRVRLGAGEAVWQAACQALVQWRHFPASWTHIYTAPGMWSEGQEVAMFFRLWGVWWLNGCRVVYTLNEAHCFGFAYGTLSSHVERGEECFRVECDAQGQVWYVVEAFSKPQFWPIRLFPFFARFHQRRFVRQSLQAMQAACRGAASAIPV